ncbi:hypothetical protein BC936DRAFT_141764 [Jimgerdemannia flammicorona]|uniref:Glutathione peroxidase n=1 Tax=Jimgerdemannia flammicorona TaxID=994334 RepID=A0A433A1N9_9FUNG|nr:hypothetical protein BC936DRAFT_141764 [Jimgerdemannia flammicorona]
MFFVLAYFDWRVVVWEGDESRAEQRGIARLTIPYNNSIQRIKWNFEKFLIDRQGKVFKRYASAVEPKAIKKDIENLL